MPPSGKQCPVGKSSYQNENIFSKLNEHEKRIEKIICDIHLNCVKKGFERKKNTSDFLNDKYTQTDRHNAALHITKFYHVCSLYFTIGNM